jgi:hypothetical protein
MHVESQKRGNMATGGSSMLALCLRWSARPIAPPRLPGVLPAGTRPSLFGGD